jgi:hypothetical protein
VAAIPTAGLLVGSALGLTFPSVPLFPGFAALIAAVCASAWAWRTSKTTVLAAGVGVGFAAGGFVLAIDAWQSAWSPPLRSMFEAAAQAEREEAARAGRILPDRLAASC